MTDLETIDPPEITTIPARLTAVIPVCVPRDQIQAVMGPGISELMAAIAAQGISPTGPWFTHHLRMPSDVFDFEIGVPVGAKVAPVGRVHPSEWLAMKVARTVYRGSYEGLGAGWGEFVAWIRAHDHPAAEDFYEQYLVGPETGPDASKYRTELSVPLRR